MYFDFLNRIYQDYISDLYYQTRMSGTGTGATTKPDFWGLLSGNAGKNETTQNASQDKTTSQGQQLTGYQKIMADSAAKRMRALQNKNTASYGGKASNSWLEAYQNSLYWGGRKFF